MRKRLGLLFMPVVVGLALMLPATTAASSLGKLGITDQYCTGGTVHVTFQVVKNVNHYADRFTLTATRQGSNDEHSWYSTGSKFYDYTIFDPWARAYFTKTLKYNSTFFWSRISGTARYYDGGTLVGTARITSGHC